MMDHKALVFIQYHSGGAYQMLYQRVEALQLVTSLYCFDGQLQK